MQDQKILWEYVQPKLRNLVHKQVAIQMTS